MVIFARIWLAINKKEVLVARVAGKGLSDEMKGRFYAVLETPDGSAYHVPLDAKSAEAVGPGDIVLFGTRPELCERPIDRQISDKACSARWIYELDPAGDDADRARATRRLRELERDGFVSARGPDRWSVPADLLERLESRPRTEPPRERLWLQKLPLSLDATPNHRGPVWLDQVDSASLAPWGFGADVGRALDQRREALRALGIAPGDPRMKAKLQEMERSAVGQHMAARTRQQFVAMTPDGFRGRLQAGPEGVPYVAVSDGARFVIVPASRELRALAGKSVVVSRDAHGRVKVQAPERDRGR